MGKEITDSFDAYSERSALANEDEIFSSLSTSAMLARNAVPASHRRAADNYVIIKRIYKFHAVQGNITNTETELLQKYRFKQLEHTNIKQLNEELVFLKKMSNSGCDEKRKDADHIIQIRARELKYIVASRYASVSDEFSNGYRALERYFEEITKFYS